jgi:phosphoribosylglycinamide formyltransferase-1
MRCPKRTRIKGEDMKNIVVLVSGGGTNLQALIDAEKNGIITNGRITCVISSKADAYALERARQNGIKTRVLVRKEYPDIASYSLAMKNALDEEKADLVVYAGFMTILDEQVCRAYPYKMMNVHPALIPSFCGKGFYGLRVHEAVLASGVKITGATVHFVTEECDGGPIILQKAVEVRNGDTPEILQKRVMEQAEWKILPQAAALFCDDRIEITDGIAHIKEASV